MPGYSLTVSGFVFYLVIFSKDKTSFCLIRSGINHLLKPAFFVSLSNLIGEFLNSNNQNDKNFKGK